MESCHNESITCLWKPSEIITIRTRKLTLVNKLPSKFQYATATLDILEAWANTVQEIRDICQRTDSMLSDKTKCSKNQNGGFES